MSLTPALPHERPTIERLLQLCLHDYTSHDPFPISEDGLFHYPWLDEYWRSPRRRPYLIRHDGRIAGFVFVREPEPDDSVDWQWSIAEFFVLRGLRRQGVGLAAALAVLRTAHGSWEICYDVRNEAARQFWNTVVRRVDPSLAAAACAPNRERYLVPAVTRPDDRGPEPKSST